MSTIWKIIILIFRKQKQLIPTIHLENVSDSRHSEMNTDHSNEGRNCVTQRKTLLFRLRKKLGNSGGRRIWAKRRQDFETESVLIASNRATSLLRFHSSNPSFFPHLFSLSLLLSLTLPLSLLWPYYLLSLLWLARTLFSLLPFLFLFSFYFSSQFILSL